MTLLEEICKGDQTILWSQGHHLYHSYWSLLRLLSSEKSLLVLCKFLRLFLNTLTANDKCSLLNRDDLRQPIQMKLSQKQITLFEFVSAFLKSRLNFEHFQKKRCFSQIQKVQKVPFHRTLRKATCKGKQTMLKSEPHHLYHIYLSLLTQFCSKKCLLVICKVLRMFVKYTD